MFGKDVSKARINLDRVPHVSPEVAKLVADADPAVLRQALEDIAVAKRLNEIEDEINVIGKERSRMAERATKLTHEREKLLGQDFSAVPRCVSK